MKKLSLYECQTIGKALAVYAETLKQRAKEQNWQPSELAASLADIHSAARACNVSQYVQIGD